MGSSARESNGALSEAGAAESKGSTMYSVYIVRCSDGTLYVGHTKNPSAREKNTIVAMGPAILLVDAPSI